MLLRYLWHVLTTWGTFWKSDLIFSLLEVKKVVLGTLTSKIKFKVGLPKGTSRCQIGLLTSRHRPLASQTGLQACPLTTSGATSPGHVSDHFEHVGLPGTLAHGQRTFNGALMKINFNSTMAARVNLNFNSTTSSAIDAAGVRSRHSNHANIPKWWQKGT